MTRVIVWKMNSIGGQGGWWGNQRQTRLNNTTVRGSNNAAAAVGPFLTIYLLRKLPENSSSRKMLLPILVSSILCSPITLSLTAQSIFTLLLGPLSVNTFTLWPSQVDVHVISWCSSYSMQIEPSPQGKAGPQKKPLWNLWLHWPTSLGWVLGLRSG